MKEQGHSIIIITHKLNEVMDISDRVAILRKGAVHHHRGDGPDQRAGAYRVDGGPEGGPRTSSALWWQRPGLCWRFGSLTIDNDEGAVAIDKVSFYIRGGEILGVAGIAGCGQKELCEAIAGLRPVRSGLMIHKGDNIVGSPPRRSWTRASPCPSSRRTGWAWAWRLPCPLRTI